MDTFPFNPPIKVSPEKWLLAVTSFEAVNSVFTKTDKNKSFSISSPSYWVPEDGEEPLNELNELLELQSQNDFVLLVREIDKKAVA